MPLASMVAVPVVRPVPSRNVFVPLLSVVTVVEMRPSASRWCLLGLSKGYQQEADCHDGDQPENNPHAGVGHHSLPRASAVQI